AERRRQIDVPADPVDRAAPGPRDRADRRRRRRRGAIARAPPARGLAAQRGALSASDRAREHRVLRPAARARRARARGARRCIARPARSRRDRGPQSEGVLAGRADESRARSRARARAAAPAARRADERARRDGRARAARVAEGASQRRLLRAAVEPRDAGGRGARRRPRDHRERAHRGRGHAGRARRPLSRAESRGHFRPRSRGRAPMNAAWTVCRKEQLDNARDRRTLFSAFVFGPLLGPVLFAVLINVLVTQTVSTAEATVEVPIIGSELAPNLVEHLEARGIEPLTEHGLEKLPDALAAVQNGRRDVVLLIEPDFAERFTAGE